MIAQIVGSFIVIIIAVSLYGPITEQVNLAAEGANVTGFGAQLLKVTPMLFAVCVLVIGMGMAYMGLRNAGLFGEDENEESEDDYSDDEYEEEEDDYEEEEEEEPIVKAIKKGAKIEIKVKEPEVIPRTKKEDINSFEKNLNKSKFEGKTEFD